MQAMAVVMAAATDRLDHLVTLRDVLRHLTSRFNAAGLFFGHGTANAFDEAAHLILHVLHLPQERLDPFLDARLSAEEIGEILALAKRRIDERMPLAYLLNEAWLGDLPFYVDQRVIVPRSFIAELLRDGLEPWLDQPDEVRRALDLCTGSACLAIVLAHVFENAQIDAADISDAALAVAKRNVDAYNLQERVSLIESDLFDALDGRRYDLIVSNPPYVDAASMASLPAEYRHEPQLALAGGEAGIDLVRRIINRARSKLNPGGVLIVEVGHNRAAVEAEFPDLRLTWLETSGGSDFVFLAEYRDLP